MNDKAIRQLLLKHLEGKHIIEEFTLNGKTRLDIGVVGERVLTGYEIKGKTDSLKLLPQQVKYYSSVCSFAYIVAYGNHLHKAMEMVPDWWGVFEAVDGQAPGMRMIRASKRNPNLDSQALLEIFWSDELVDVVKSRGIKIKGSRAGDRMRALLVDIGANEISSILCQTIRDRGDWRERRRQELATYWANVRQHEWQRTGHEGEPPADWVSEAEKRDSEIREESHKHSQHMRKVLKKAGLK